MSRRIVIEFLGKDSSLGSTADMTGRKTSKLGDTLKRVGKVAAIGLAAGAVVAGRALVGMTKNAMEDEAAQRKLAIALQNATGATDKQIDGVEKWISAQGRLLGVTDDEMRPALQRLAEATGDIDEAQRQMGIAMDVSAGTGKSLKVVTEALMKANNGTTASLSRLGLKTKDAEGNTLSLEDALAKMSDTFGGQAAAKAATFEGKMDRLKLIFDETKESIGAKLIPVLTDLADWFLEDGLPAIERFVGWVRDELIPAIKDMADWVKRNEEVLTPIAAILTGIAAAIALVVAATKVWAAVQAVLNVVLTANPIGIVVVAIGALVAALVYAYKKSDTARKIMDTNFTILRVAAQLLAAVMKAAFDKIVAAIKILGTIGRWLWNSVFQPVFKFLVSGIAQILRLWSEMLRVLGRVPGFGWAKSAADAMANAAGKAQALANNIRDIPAKKDVFVRYHETTIRSIINKQTNDPRIGLNARGTDNWRGGLTWVGEEGPEIVDLPKGTRILSAQESKSMVGGGTSVGVVGHAVVDLRLDGRIVQRVLLKLKRTTGEELGLA